MTQLGDFLDTRYKALRLGDWYYGDDKLILGTRCMLDVDNETFSCYIQEILKDEDKCVVYITKLAERWTVKYSDLKREDNAKPWPLPYRFARNLPIQPSPNLPPCDNDHKSLRKRRERKRLDSLNDNNSQLDLKDVNGNIPDLNINNYEGYPLLMQEMSNASLLEKPITKLHIPKDHNSSAESAEDWNQITNASGSESIPLSWISIPANCQENCSSFANKATSTPIPATYKESNNGSVYYNCMSDYSYSSVPVWAQPNYVVSPDSGINSGVMLNDTDVSPLDPGKNYQNYVYYQPDSAYGSPAFLSPPIGTPTPPFAPFSVSLNDRFVCSTPITPASPHVEMYPFVYPVASPGTPVVYSQIPPPPLPPPPTTTPRPIEVVTSIRSPVPVYNTPNEYQCVNSPTYIYPPTPPVTWYTPNANAQGFIFPPPPPNPPSVPTFM